MIRQRVWHHIAAAALGVAIVVATGTCSASRRARTHQDLLTELRPVSLSNCQFERFGEPNDGGYLLCANLLGAAESAYSYGIAGYDGWGCDVSRRLNLPVHQYDCFDTRRPACPGGRPIFHAECVGGERTIDEADRLFDTLAHQLVKNGDARRRLIVKMDIEGAEWHSLARTPDSILQRIDQLSIELHHPFEAPLSSIMRRLRLDQPLTPRLWIVDDHALAVIRRLKRYFHVAHVHFNNYACTGNLSPLPAWAYEVLFVNRTLGVEDSSPHPHKSNLLALDAPNNPEALDCQVDFP
jgi:hypothetical protein